MGKMRVLITGGYGYLGQWLTEYLVNVGHDVCILSRNSAQTATALPIHHLQVDVSRIKECKQALKGNQFDCIVHIASANNSRDPNFAEQAIKTNVLGTRNLLESIELDNLKNFIYLSTFHVYGSIKGTITEESKISPQNDYAATHFFAEEYIRQFNTKKNLPYTILRLTNGYGCPKTPQSGNWNLLINDLARSAYQEKIIILKSNAQDERDFIWLGTICEVINKILSLNAAPNDTFNLANQMTYKLLDIAHLVHKAYAEFSGNRLVVEINTNNKLPENNSLHVSSAKLKQIINYESPDKLLEEIKAIFLLLKRSEI